MHLRCPHTDYGLVFSPMGPCLLTWGDGGQSESAVARLNTGTNLCDLGGRNGTTKARNQAVVMQAEMSSAPAARQRGATASSAFI